jgi:hypothetical protein
MYKSPLKFLPWTSSDASGPTFASSSVAAIALPFMVRSAALGMPLEFSPIWKGI